MLQLFKQCIKPSSICIEESVISKCYGDWLGQYPSKEIQAKNPGFVLQPDSEDEIVKIVQLCNNEKISIVPQGGNTGLVGGSVPTRGDEIVLSLRRMNKIIDFDSSNRVVSCEAGCILHNINEYLQPHGFTMPLDLGSSGSCMIGGNVSTNAGGIRFVQYGSLRSNVLGLDVITGKGEKLHLMNSLRKDNTGYDLKQLFIGSEGTLGIITRVAIATHILPKYSATVLLGFDNYHDLLSTYLKARRMFGNSIAAIEYWDAGAMHMSESLTGTSFRKSLPSKIYLLTEIAGSNSQDTLQEMMEQFLGDEQNGILANTEKIRQDMWRVRESIAVSLKHKGGHTYKYDVSLPIQTFNDISETVRRKLGEEFPDVSVYQYGHIGDGNLHLNVWSPSFDVHVKKMIETVLYGYIQDKNGSISAEHGIGVMKAATLAKVKSPQVMSAMRDMKRVFDPNNILNPGKIIIDI